jgi:hypothetical protein
MYYLIDLAAANVSKVFAKVYDWQFRFFIYAGIHY